MVADGNSKDEVDSYNANYLQADMKAVLQF